MKPTLLSILTLLFIPLPDRCFAQDMERDQTSSIYVVQGIVIEQHPDPYLQHKYEFTSPVDALECHPANQRAACGKAFWNDKQLPLDRRYYTTIPAVIRMDGPTKDVLFAPFARCIITDKNGKRLSADAPGITCKTLLEHPGDYLRWAFGGVVESGGELEHGLYTGVIPVTVTDHVSKWEFDMPISLDVKKRIGSCELAAGSEVYDFGEISTLDASPTNPLTDTATLNLAVAYTPGAGEADRVGTSTTRNVSISDCNTSPCWLTASAEAGHLVLSYRFTSPIPGDPILSARVSVKGACE